jgi:hypothetical protein
MRERERQGAAWALSALGGAALGVCICAYTCGHTLRSDLDRVNARRTGVVHARAGSVGDAEPHVRPDV